MECGTLLNRKSNGISYFLPKGSRIISAVSCRRPTWITPHTFSYMKCTVCMYVCMYVCERRRDRKNKLRQCILYPRYRLFKSGLYTMYAKLNLFVYVCMYVWRAGHCKPWRWGRSSTWFHRPLCGEMEPPPPASAGSSLLSGNSLAPLSPPRWYLHILRMDS